MLTHEDHMILRRLPVETHGRLLAADRRDARIMSDRTAFRGCNLPKASLRNADLRAASLVSAAL